MKFEAELARINVLRLRGDLQAARQLCGELLQHKPESEQAHALMGELCLDAGQFDQAADWFEMAASHAPDSANLKLRADQARRRLEELEALATAKKLGIPTSRSKMHIFAGTMLALVVTICALAFYIGGQLGKANKIQTINTPLKLSQAPSLTPDSPVTPSQPGFALPASDERLLKSLQETSSLGARILLAYRDPRGPSLVISLEAPPGEFTTKELSNDASALLTENAEAASVTVRYMRAGESLAMAKLTRANHDAAIAAGKPLGGALEDIWPSLESPKPEKTGSTETHPASSESVTLPAAETTGGPQGN